jgi:hypothetical protein
VKEEFLIDVIQPGHIFRIDKIDRQMYDVVHVAAGFPQQGLQILERLPCLGLDRAVGENARFQIDGNDRGVHHAAGEDRSADLMSGLGPNGSNRPDALPVLSRHWLNEATSSPDPRVIRTRMYSN